MLEGALQSGLNLLKVSWLFSECGIVAEARGALSDSAICRRIASGDAFEVPLQ
jgi:hypothetical protein